MALASGEVQFFVGPLAGNMMGLIESGRVKPLAVSGPARIAGLPDIPTFAETGLREYTAVGYFGIMAPAGTPREVVGKINAGNKAVRSSEVAKALAEQGIAARENTPAEFAAMVKNDLDDYAKLVNDGIVLVK